ncbi:hypothetical protein [Halostella litorea]|uniref:hypothetical protein n=1 Tax=Halostella litorea TaxID=2528831 RepID=UPI001092587C|nr:hypothetical protein [Halostella litorea]
MTATIAQSAFPVSTDLLSTLLMAVAIVLGALASLWLVGKLAAWRRGDATKTDDTEQRLREDAEPGVTNETIGLRNYPKRWTPTAKLFLVVAILSLVMVSYAAYSYAQTGSPSDTPYLQEISALLFGTILMYGGVWVYRRQEAKATEVDIIRETKKGNTEETLYVEKERIRPIQDDDGEAIAVEAPLFHKTRLFGLFWKRKFNADEPELRDRDYRLPTDRTIVRVPISDESTTVQGDYDKITVHTKRMEPVDLSDRNYDYRFQTSDRKSSSEVDQLHQTIEELESEYRHVRKMNAVLSKQVDEYEQMLENEEYFMNKRQREWLSMFLPIMTGMSSQRASHLMQMDPEDATQPQQGQNGAGMRKWPSNAPTNGSAPDPSAQSDAQTSD